MINYVMKDESWTMIDIDSTPVFLVYDYDDVKKTKTYYPSNYYKYKVVKPACMREDQVKRYIRRTYGL